MAGLTVPVISIVIGEGGSGGALALGVCNKLYMLENSTYSVISPEGAASILFKDASLKEIAAESLKITADDLLELGVSDGTISEPAGDKTFVFNEIETVLVDALGDLRKLNGDELVDQRYEKYMAIGQYEE